MRSPSAANPHCAIDSHSSLAAQNHFQPLIMVAARCLQFQIKACALPGALLTDSFPAYQAAYAHAFRTARQTGRAGCPALETYADFVLAQTMKWQEAGRCRGIRVCHLFGDCAGIARLLPCGQVLNTAYIERLNATFRQRLSGFGWRSHCLLRKETSVADGTDRLPLERGRTARLSGCAAALRAPETAWASAGKTSKSRSAAIRRS